MCNVIVGSIFDGCRIYGMKPRNVGWRKHCAIHPSDPKGGIEMTDCDDGFLLVCTNTDKPKKPESSDDDHVT